MNKHNKTNIYDNVLDTEEHDICKMYVHKKTYNIHFVCNNRALKANCFVICVSHWCVHLSLINVHQRLLNNNYHVF